VDSVQAIVVNYIVAGATGIWMTDLAVGFADLPLQVLLFAGGMGVLFFSIFNVMALTAQRNGVSVAAVASKMALVIPVFFGIVLFNEHLGMYKLMGVILGLISVYFVSVKATNAQRIKAYLGLPLLLFLGSGLIDTGLKYAQEFLITDRQEAVFSASIFFAAFVFGMLYLLVSFLKGKRSAALLKPKNIVAGVVLGVPNFFSIFFLLKALQSGVDSVVVFTINNIGIVLLSTLLGVLIFKELLKKKNIIGIVMAVGAIGLIALSMALDG
ncbi:MAG: EamA/RhaT family transporter, partial [Flavobacteriaceae bacterium]|nr:EamA/RhaT family transporter [Flavobacteriaceae bacterium]